MQIQKKNVGAGATADIAVKGISAEIARPATNEAVAKIDKALRGKVDKIYLDGLKMLRRAQRILKDESKWCKGALFLGPAGQEDAYCALGALGKVYDHSNPRRAYSLGVWDNERTALGVAYARLTDATGLGNVPSLNDSADTTHQDILDLFNRAASTLKAEARAKAKE